MSSDGLAGSHPDLPRRELAALLYSDGYWPWERWIASRWLNRRTTSEVSFSVQGDGSAVIQVVRDRSVRILSEHGSENTVVAVIEPRTFCGSRVYSRADLALLSVCVIAMAGDSATVDLRLLGAWRSSAARVRSGLAAAGTSTVMALPPISELNRRPVEPDELRACRSGELGGSFRLARFAVAALAVMAVLVWLLQPPTLWGLGVFVLALAGWYASTCWLGIAIRRRQAQAGRLSR